MHIDIIKQRRHGEIVYSICLRYFIMKYDLNDWRLVVVKTDVENLPIVARDASVTALMVLVTIVATQEL